MKRVTVIYRPNGAYRGEVKTFADHEYYLAWLEAGMHVEADIVPNPLEAAVGFAERNYHRWEWCKILNGETTADPTKEM